MINPTIWLVRHSIRESIDGETDCSISTAGIELAEITGKKLKSFVGETKTIIYTSPFRRTKETAFVINKFLETSVYNESKICEVIIPYYLNYMTVNLPKELENYLQTYGIHYPETIQNVYNRCSDFLNKIKCKNDFDNIIVVSHGGTINVMLSIIFDWYHEKFNLMEHKKADEYIPKYCDYIGVKLIDGQWKIINSNWLQN